MTIRYKAIQFFLASYIYMPAPLLKAQPRLLRTTSKWGKLQLPEGQFVGETIADQPGHYGQLTYHNGDHYEGEFKNRRPEGSGSQDYENGAKYRGDFKNGLPHGHGMKRYPNQLTFVGQFVNGKEDGVGVLAIIQKKNGSYKPYLATYKEGKRLRHTEISRQNPLVVKAMDMIYDFEGEAD
jgi:hypothetical protein